MPTMAAILFMVAYNMSHWKSCVQVIKTAPKSDIAVLVITFVLTVVFDLVVAIEIGMLLACLLFMKRMSDETSVKSWKYSNIYEEERDILTIKFKSDRNLITNEVPSDISIDRFINIFYAAMVSNGWSDTVIVTAINQYVNDEDYPYEYSDGVFDENENNHFVEIIGKGSYSDVRVKVEYPEDSTALDIVNILYGLLINLTYTRTTVIRAFRTFVEENEELLFDSNYSKELLIDTSVLHNDDMKCTDQITVNLNEELIATNNDIKDPFIQSIVKSMKK
jgi:hypothetical protein